MFSESYNDLTNKPTIPTNVSDLTNDSGYLTTHQDLSSYALTTQLFSESYNDLTDRPTIPSNVSDLTNDSGYLTTHQDLSSYALTSQLFSESYNDLTNKPTIPTIPTNVSSFTNDSGYLTSYVDTTYSVATSSTLGLVKIGYGANGKNYPVEISGDKMFVTVPWTDTDTDTNTNTTYTAGSGLTLTSTSFSVDSTIAPKVYVDNAISDLVNGADAAFDTLSEIQNAMATDVELATAIGNLSIPSNVSDLTNDSGYLTTHQDLSSYALTTQLFSESYNDLTNTPTIPVIPTNVSAFANDSGYITNASIPTNHMVTDSNNTVSGSQIPSTDNTYDLGSETKQWRTIYAHEVEATYADLAERYESDEKLQVGTVVTFGGDAEITKCTYPSDVSVAGIISGQPALKMNSAAGTDHTHPYVALRGRVPCQVIGPVTKGDLLVTSSTPGFAKSVGKVDMGLAVFAKAIETNLEDGEKLVEVVVV